MHTKRTTPQPPVDRICEQCGTSFTKVPSKIAIGSGKFCSQACYHDHQRSSSPSRLSRFWAKVQKTETCWLWTGAQHRTGYGMMSTGRTTSILAHRLAYELLVGTIPDGLFVCHHCDVRLCVNPAHLFLGTNADNMADMAAKGRARNNPARGEQAPNVKLTEAMVREIRDPSTADVPLAVLAKRFGVTKSAICDVRKRRHWAHIP